MLLVRRAESVRARVRPCPGNLFPFLINIYLYIYFDSDLDLLPLSTLCNVSQLSYWDYHISYWLVRTVETECHGVELVQLNPVDQLSKLPKTGKTSNQIDMADDECCLRLMTATD